jgi:hypothetical protein
VKELITVEHDQPWAKKIMERYPTNSNHQWIVHPLPANNSTSIEDLHPTDVRSLKAFYQEIAERMVPVDLLFVDTYRCARVVAVESLLQKARWMILHDVEPLSIPWYGWEKLSDRLKSLACYYHRPQGYIAKTHHIAWTLLAAHDHLSIEQLGLLNTVVRRESFKLWSTEVELDG